MQVYVDTIYFSISKRWLFNAYLRFKNHRLNGAINLPLKMWMCGCGSRTKEWERERERRNLEKRKSQFINKINSDEMKANQMKGNIIYYHGDIVIINNNHCPRRKKTHRKCGILRFRRFVFMTLNSFSYQLTNKLLFTLDTDLHHIIYKWRVFHRSLELLKNSNAFEYFFFAL